MSLYVTFDSDFEFFLNLELLYFYFMVISLALSKRVASSKHSTLEDISTAYPSYPQRSYNVIVYPSGIQILFGWKSKHSCSISVSNDYPV